MAPLTGALLAAIPVVHTTGVNIESLAIILGGIAAMASAIVVIQERRTRAIRDQADDIRGEIKTAVEHLGDVLTARLETKDKVSTLNARVARVEGVLGIAIKD